jgi:hypothetical protein
MTEITVLGVVALTSAAAYRVGRRWLDLGRAGLGAALARVLEVLGLAAAFLLTNLAIGVLAIVAARHLAGWFVSVYLLDDLSLVVLSFVQGLAFDLWRRAGRETGRPVV